MSDGRVVQADRYLGDVVMIGTEAQVHRCVGDHRAKGYSIQAIARIVAQAIVFDVVIVAVPGTDRQNMRDRVVTEGHLGIIGQHTEGNVGPILYAALTIVYIPALIERHLAFIVSRWKSGGLKRINAISVRVLQPRAQTTRI